MTLSLLDWIPEGDGGTLATLSTMARNANRAQVDPLTVETAHRIILACRPRDTYCYAASIRNWLSRHFQFVPDALDVDRPSEPRYLLGLLDRQGIITGDCDDAATLGAALGKAIGLPAQFTVLGFPSTGGNFAHVFASLETERGWLELDITRPTGPVERAIRQYDFPV